MVRCVELATGPSGSSPEHVRITGLPLALDNASVRIRAEGAVQACDYSVEIDHLDTAPPVPPDEEAIRKARVAVSALETRRAALSRMVRRLSEITAPARPAGAKGSPPVASPHEARRALLAFREERLRATHQAVRDLDAELRTAQEQLAALEDAKRRASNDPGDRIQAPRKTVEVQLRSNGAHQNSVARLTLEYAVPGARWAPAYVLQFSNGWAEASFSTRAVVAQRTGEDWHGVQLRLSTAALHSRTELPELASVRLGRRQAQRRSGWRNPPTGAHLLFADYDRSFGPPPTPPAPAPPTPESPPAEFAALFNAPSPPQSAPMPTGAAGGEFTRVFSTQSRAARPSMAPRPPAPAPPTPPPKQEDRPVETWDAPPSLDYGALHMPAPDQPGRGKLSPRMDSGFLGTEAMNAIQAAQFSATCIGKFPPGHSAPSPVDGFDYAYQTATLVDVPSDGEFHTIPLTGAFARPRIHYVSVPRIANHAFRYLELDNLSGTPILPGPCDVIAGSAFLMTVPLRLTPPGGILKAGLGVEQRIKVARNTTFAEETTGFINGTLQLRHEIRIELRNLLPVPADIEVRERIPVKREGDDQIQIQWTANPSWETYQTESGKLRGGQRWRVRVDAGASASLQGQYSIAIPARNELAGGNRRED